MFLKVPKYSLVSNCPWLLGSKSVVGKSVVTHAFCEVLYWMFYTRCVVRADTAMPMLSRCDMSGHASGVWCQISWSNTSSRLVTSSSSINRDVDARICTCLALGLSESTLIHVHPTASLHIEICIEITHRDTHRSETYDTRQSCLHIGELLWL